MRRWPKVASRARGGRRMREAGVAAAESRTFTKRRMDMRRVLISLVAVTGLVALVGGLAGGQTRKPDATLELSEGSVAVGIGFSWGKGTLVYQGKRYPLKVDGLAVGEVGITRATARGDVFNL